MWLELMLWFWLSDNTTEQCRNVCYNNIDDESEHMEEKYDDESQDLFFMF